MKRTFLFLFGLSLVFFSCSKGGINGSKYAGEYELYKYELRYFNGDNTEDSTFTVEDVAHLGLFDEGGTFGNEFNYSSTSVPRSWVDYGLGIPISWYSDNGRGNTITLSMDVGQFVTYDVEKDGFRKYKWTLVYPGGGGINYVETLYLQKK